jgi:hypothetical protein
LFARRRQRAQIHPTAGRAFEGTLVGPFLQARQAKNRRSEITPRGADIEDLRDRDQRRRPPTPRKRRQRSGAINSRLQRRRRPLLQEASNSRHARAASQRRPEPKSAHRVQNLRGDRGHGVEQRSQFYREIGEGGVKSGIFSGADDASRSQDAVAADARETSVWAKKPKSPPLAGDKAATANVAQQPRVATTGEGLDPHPVRADEMVPGIGVCVEAS